MPSSNAESFSFHRPSLSELFVDAVSGSPPRAEAAGEAEDGPPLAAPALEVER